MIQNSRRGRIHATLVHSQGVINDAPANSHRMIQHSRRGRIYATLAYVSMHLRLYDFTAIKKGVINDALALISAVFI